MKPSNLKASISNFFLISVPTLLILFFLVELVFRIIVKTPDRLPWTWDKEYKFLKFDPTKKKEGWNFLDGQKTKWTINNHGWVSHIDFDTIKNKPRIGVIGDSFVQAEQVNTGKAFHGLLHDQLKDSVDVYGIGTNGAPLSHYLYLAKYAAENFKPDILVFNIIHNDFSESIYELNAKNDLFWTFEKNESGDWTAIKPHSKKKQTKPNPTNRLITKIRLFLLEYSAFGRYVISQLDKQAIINLSKNQNKIDGKLHEADSLEHEAEIKAVVHQILVNIKASFPKTKLLFIMDAPRGLLYPTKLKIQKTNILNKLMAEACKNNQLPLLDLTIPFQTDYQLNQKKFEFETDGHWNEHGHKVVFKSLLDYLQTNQYLNFDH